MNKKVRRIIHEGVIHRSYLHRFTSCVRSCGRLGAHVMFLAARVQEIMWIMEHVHEVNAWPSAGTVSLVGWRVEMAAHVLTCVDPSRVAALVKSLKPHKST